MGITKFRYNWYRFLSINLLSKNIINLNVKSQSNPQYLLSSFKGTAAQLKLAPPEPGKSYPVNSGKYFSTLGFNPIGFSSSNTYLANIASRHTPLKCILYLANQLYSNWIFQATFTICLFMGFCKRYSEVVTLGDMAIAKNHRPTLIVYTPELLTHLVTISAGIAVIAFLIYGLSERTINQFGTDYFIYTLPVVVYAVFRFTMLSMSGSYTGPTELILRDRPFQVTIVIWAVLMLVIIIYGKDLQNWVQGFY